MFTITLRMFSNLPVDWPRFSIAAVVLIFPLPMLFGRGVQYRELDRSWNRFTGKLFSLPWHWIDLLRAFGATKLLMSAVTYSYLPTAAPVPKGVFLLMAAVFALGVVLQTVACKCPEGFHVPCIYVFAITAAFFPPVFAGFTLVSALTVAIAVRSVTAFFFAMPFCLAILGEFLFPQWLPLGVWAPASVLPALLPMMFQRDSMLAHRAVPPEPDSELK